MTLVSLGGPRGWPHEIPAQTSQSFATNLTLNAATEYGGVVTQAPRTGTIDRIAFLVGTVTTTGDLVCKVEQVSATDGFPNGTLYDANATVTRNVLDTEDNTIIEVTFATPWSITQGDLICIMIESDTGSAFDGQIKEAANWALIPPYAGGFPYWVQDTGATAKDDTGGVMSLRYDDGEWTRFPGCVLIESVTLRGINSSDDPDERGIKFTVPVGMNVKGVWWHGDATGDHTIKLYDTDGTTVLASVAVDADQAATIGDRVRAHTFASDVELTKDSTYRATCLPGAVDIDPVLINFADAAHMETIYRGGVVRTHRTDAGSWTDVADESVLMSLIIDSVDIPLGGVSLLFESKISMALLVR